MHWESFNHNRFFRNSLSAKGLDTSTRSLLGLSLISTLHNNNNKTIKTNIK